MKQQKIEKVKMNPTEEDAKNLEKEFNDVKKKVVQPATRKVVLYHHCAGRFFEREVPFNSVYKDGDTVPDSDRQSNDKWTPKSPNRSGRTIFPDGTIRK